MTTTSSISAVSGLGASAAAASAAAAAAAKSNDAADRFLTLLITQMKNQDPLNPLDNAQLTSQLAQINTVSGINKLNDTVAALSASISAGQSLQAVSLVGHLALVPGNKLELVGGKAVGGFTLPSAANNVAVTVTDAAGAVVRTMPLGTVPAGKGAFAWDGKTDAGGAAADGIYTFSVAGNVGGTAVTADTQMQGRVVGLVAGASGMQLNLGQLGLFGMSQVVEIN